MLAEAGTGGDAPSSIAMTMRPTAAPFERAVLLSPRARRGRRRRRRTELRDVQRDCPSTHAYTDTDNCVQQPTQVAASCMECAADVRGTATTMRAMAAPSHELCKHVYGQSRSLRVPVLAEAGAGGDAPSFVACNETACPRRRAHVTASRTPTSPIAMTMSPTAAPFERAVQMSPRGQSGRQTCTELRRR